ncbi:hypothetical protein CASFOL_014299 [Castilleja foliolosa]|uniref:Uncharacterized protein n=1 Tax=Castilleja foliolosa TaxID=1961234 RepID=A0ABD3DNL4_9LAMI
MNYHFCPVLADSLPLLSGMKAAMAIQAEAERKKESSSLRI